MNYALLPIDYLFSVVVDEEEVFSAASTQVFPTFSVGSKIWTKSFIEPGLGEPEGPFQTWSSDYLVVTDIQHTIHTTREGRHLFRTTVIARDPLND